MERRLPVQSQAQSNATQQEPSPPPPKELHSPNAREGGPPNHTQSPKKHFPSTHHRHENANSKQTTIPPFPFQLAKSQRIRTELREVPLRASEEVKSPHGADFLQFQHPRKQRSSAERASRASRDEYPVNQSDSSQSYREQAGFHPGGAGKSTMNEGSWRRAPPQHPTGSFCLNYYAPG